ncbi:hypothetical protein [Modestobacter excelsi]|uniref:hypothetical protein n=1 Tax=Modestobacter excelsi TaxID=2213161 RepID=UPI00110CD208|nr:hypothetical protein [Modestobacter excelsi]
MPTTTRMPDHGWGWALGCLGTVVTACAGCGHPLCPSTTFAASISVGLDPAWTSLEDLVVTVGCPPDTDTGCGFLDGPVGAPATSSVLVYTVLRPAEVDVVVSSTATGDVVAHRRVPVTYEPLGPRQTECGGDAHALVVVPAP